MKSGGTVYGDNALARMAQYGGADENSAGDFSMGARSDKCPTGNGGALLMRFG
jgi:hypothetical protein